MTRSNTTAPPPVAEPPDRRRRLGETLGHRVVRRAHARPARAGRCRRDAARISRPPPRPTSPRATPRVSISPTSTTSAATSRSRRRVRRLVDRLDLQRPGSHHRDGLVQRPAHGAAPRVTLERPRPFDGATATRELRSRRCARRRREPLAAYFFPYFTGESTADGEKISFAAQRGNDPLEWTSSTAASPCSTSTLGTKGLRDPFLIRSPEGDKFFLLATDLQIYGGGNFGAAQETGSRSSRSGSRPTS